VWPSAQNAFKALTVPLEGNIPHMYRDSKGYLTWGIGIKDDPGPTATTLGVRWIKCNGYNATAREITAEWQKIKTGPLGSLAAALVVGMYCPPDERDRAFWIKVDSFENTIRAQFAKWSTWPADAQLSVMSMAWNFGPTFKAAGGYQEGYQESGYSTGWPDLAVHLDAGDWAYAAEHCQPAAGPNERSRECKVLFFQAARAELWDDQPSALFGPKLNVSAKGLTAAAADPTRRDAYAWWVQAMLFDRGLYTLALDGQFGPRSAAAWTAYLKAKRLPAGYTQSNLTALSADTLKAQVTP
jgi:hypothetical protein